MMKRTLLILLALPFVALVVFFFVQPMFPALLCPGCFGFENLQGKLYVQRQMSDDDRQKLLKLLEQGARAGGQRSWTATGGA